MAQVKRAVIHQDSSEVLAELLDKRVVVEEPHSSEILADEGEGRGSQGEAGAEEAQDCHR